MFDGGMTGQTGDGCCQWSTMCSKDIPFSSCFTHDLSKFQFGEKYPPKRYSRIWFWEVKLKYFVMRRACHWEVNFASITFYFWPILPWSMQIFLFSVRCTMNGEKSWINPNGISPQKLWKFTNDFDCFFGYSFFPLAEARHFQFSIQILTCFWNFKQIISLFPANFFFAFNSFFFDFIFHRGHSGISWFSRILNIADASANNLKLLP